MENNKIVCRCGTTIDTTDHPPKITCPKCGSEYIKEAPKLLFLGIQEERFPAGTVIII